MLPKNVRPCSKGLPCENAYTAYDFRNTRHRGKQRALKMLACPDIAKPSSIVRLSANRRDAKTRGCPVAQYTNSPSDDKCWLDFGFGLAPTEGKANGLAQLEINFFQVSLRPRACMRLPDKVAGIANVEVLALQDLDIE